MRKDADLMRDRDTSDYKMDMTADIEELVSSIMPRDSSKTPFNIRSNTGKSTDSFNDRVAKLDLN